MQHSDDLVRRRWPGGAVLASRLVFTTLAWWILTGGAMDSWLVGVPTIALATVASTWLLPPLHWSLGGAFRFIGFFLFESLRGGVDVARRAFHRRLPLDPGIVEHVFRVDAQQPRVSITNTVSLLPGTLSADIDQRNLYVHALDAGPEVRESLTLAERRVADLFGVEVKRPERDRRPS